jgi:CheY-like chemotaxis protein
VQQQKEIWLIDDDRLDVLTVKRAFMQQNVMVPLQVFTSAGAALSEITKDAIHQPDLILLDLNMPGLDGIGFLRKIRNQNRLEKIPVFILTTSSDPGDKRTCESLMVRGFYTKPVDFFELIPDILQSIAHDKSHPA